jgi:hypothetical protein
MNRKESINQNEEEKLPPTECNTPLSFSPAAGEGQNISPADFTKFIQFTNCNFFKPWVSPDGVAKGLIIGCQAGKYCIWSVFYLYNKEKEAFYPAVSSKDYVIPITRNSSPFEYDFLVKMLK